MIIHTFRREKPFVRATIAAGRSPPGTPFWRFRRRSQHEFTAQVTICRLSVALAYVKATWL